MGDHGGSAVNVAKGLPQQHCQFAVPTGCITLLLTNSMVVFQKNNNGSRHELRRSHFKFTELTNTELMSLVLSYLSSFNIILCNNRESYYTMLTKHTR